MTKRKVLEVLEDSEIVKSFFHRFDPYRQLHYNVFNGKVGNMLSILPKRHYMLLIADIPYGFRITVSCLLTPDRCVSWVGTAEVLDYEKKEYEIRLVTNRLQEERYETLNHMSIVY